MFADETQEVSDHDFVNMSTGFMSTTIVGVRISDENK